MQVCRRWQWGQGAARQGHISHLQYVENITMRHLFVCRRPLCLSAAVGGRRWVGGPPARIAWPRSDGVMQNAAEGRHVWRFVWPSSRAQRFGAAVRTGSRVGHSTPCKGVALLHGAQQGLWISHKGRDGGLHGLFPGSEQPVKHREALACCGYQLQGRSLGSSFAQPSPTQSGQPGAGRCVCSRLMSQAQAVCSPPQPGRKGCGADSSHSLC